MELSGSVRTDDRGRLSWTDDGTDVEQAVDRAVEDAERQQRVVRSRIDMMRQYAEGEGCRRMFLLGYFGEQLDLPCGHCDTCDAGTSRTQSPPTTARTAPVPGGELRADATVDHPRWGLGTVMSVEHDRVTVLFAENGYKTLALEAVRERKLLNPLGD